MFLFHKNVITSIAINIENMKAQNYDGASNMLGPKSGVGVKKCNARLDRD